MKTFTKQFAVFISLLTANCLLPTFSFAATYTVTNTSDAGAGSLRAAITSANTNAGADKIIFYDAGIGTITLAAALPALTDNAGVTIDGRGTANTASTGGLNGTLAISINGDAIGGSNTAALSVSSDYNTIRGLNFLNAGGYGSYCIWIKIASGADNNKILGCYIGTDVTGTASAGGNTGYGVWMEGANNQIGDGTAADRNLISGLMSWFSIGIYITGASATPNRNS